MTKVIPFLVVCLFMLFATGCGEDIDQLHEEVMKIHDDVMPHMGEMHQLQQKLENAMVGKDSLERLPYLEAIGELQQGEDMMWTWMNNYRKPTSASAESVNYLEQQRQEVNKVAEQMTLAMTHSKELLP
ncbi:MAG: hypothetical protein K9I85_02945 [Saprospiraceae bacterium]|nr:hypothetical protein [Saprospiraceae bacterium]